MAFKLDKSAQETPIGFSENKIESLLKKEIFVFGNSFNSKKKFEFYNELGLLLHAGIAMREALTLIVENQKKEVDRLLFQSLLQNVVNGLPFSEAVQKSNKFSEYECFSLEIGEEVGSLPKVCKSLADFFQRKNTQRQLIISALMYPAIVLSTAILVVIFMLSYVVPMFQDIFRQNKIELPILTRIIISCSSFLKDHGIWIVFLFVVIIMGLQYLNRNPFYRMRFQRLLLKTPVFGIFISKVYLAQFAQSMSLLITSKVPILNSISLIKKMIQFIPLQQSLEKIENNILLGKSLSESMLGIEMFDNRIISLIKVAEETNQTEFVFNQLKDQLNEEVIQHSKVFSTFLEPFIILVVGIIIGILLIAMYLPMFKLSSAIG